MNKYRLNQILESLLFPLIDSKQCKEDMLFACYNEYYKNTLNRRQTVYRKENSRFYAARAALIEYLIRQNRWKVKSEDDVEKICEFFHPMKAIDNYILSMEEDWILTNGTLMPEAISGYYILEVLPLISNSLLTYRDGVAAIRPWIDKGECSRKDIFGNISVFNKIEVWNLLCRMCNPDIFIAIEAVECGLGLEALYGQRTSVVLADKLLVKSLQNGVAENHMHFNVGYDYDVLWLYNMQLVHESVERNNPKNEFVAQDILLKCAVFRCVAAIYLERNKNQKKFWSWLETEFGKDSEIVYMTYMLRVGKCEDKITSNMIREINALYYKVTQSGRAADYDYLFDKIYSKHIKYRTTSEYIFLFQCYKYIKNAREDVIFTHLFLQYIRLKNSFFSQSHETNVLSGFKYFQKKYNIASNKLRENFQEEKRLIELFRAQSKVRYLRKLEVRITPEVGLIDIAPFDYWDSKNYILESLYKQLLNIFTAYKHFIRENMEEMERETSALQFPNVGIVFHLLKREYFEDISGICCWKSIVSGNTCKVEHIFERRYFIRNIAKAIEEIRQTIPKMDEYVVGLDAASDEVVEEPWVYSMAYQVVRSRESTKPVVQNVKYRNGYNRIQNIGFTYHVGEEFRHIVSGLRHIDEVIEEFGYKPGDRIGHAMAVGIDVEKWLEDNKVIMLPVQEYMENLLWIWGIGIYENVNLGIELEKLENKILDIARGIYPALQSLSVQLLYQAYKEKFSDKHREIAERYLKQLRENEGSHLLCTQENCRCCLDERGAKDWLLLTNYCPRFVEKYRTIMALASTREDAELYTVLQAHIVKKLEEKGIYIETNPTSNLTIGEFSQMSQHPIFFLNNDRLESKNHVMVTINSDDPSVFGTNIENEFAYIYYAAEARGHSKEEILRWIDKIRVHGMNASFIQVDKNADVILEEVENIISHIRNKLYGGGH